MLHPVAHYRRDSVLTFTRKNLRVGLVLAVVGLGWVGISADWTFGANKVFAYPLCHLLHLFFPSPSHFMLSLKGGRATCVFVDTTLIFFVLLVLLVFHR